MILRGFLLLLVSFAAFGADKYALVAAMGDQFVAASEGQKTGSRLPNYEKRSLDVQGEGINKLALASLDIAVRKMHPQAERIHLAVPLSKDIQLRVRSIEENAFSIAVQALRARADRSSWHRIVLVTPYTRVQQQEVGGLAPDTQGVGLMSQGNCQSDIRDCHRRRPNSGVEVETPAGEKVVSSRYVAPYFFAKVWVLDPESLQVLDSEVVADHTKYNDPDSEAMDQNSVLDRRFLLTKIVEQVEKSTTQAVSRTELRGKVEVNEKGVR